MLESPRESSTPLPGTFKNVVKDYLNSHKHKENIDAFYAAVRLTIDKSRLWLYVYIYC